MVWWLTLGGFVLGCLVAWAFVQHDSDDKDE